MIVTASRPEWRGIAVTPWATREPRRGIASGGAHARQPAVERLLANTWRLPTWVPASSARHTLSALLPAAAGLASLLRALHGRLVVVNQSPVAVCPRADAALVRGLVSAGLDGLPAAPWPTAMRDRVAAWPPDSRAAHAAVLAHAWLARYDRDRTVAPASAVAVGLYEGPTRVVTAESGELGREHAPEVRARVASRLPARELPIPRVVATIEYRLVVVVRRDAPGADGPPDATVSAALTTGRALGASGAGTIWFSGTVLLPDPALVAAMDARSRQRWAAFTGRGGIRDAYWHPESWARFTEPGRAPGYVSAATVGRSMPGHAHEGATSATALNPAVERGVSVPPGYGLVDCVGTLGVAVVVT